jgi:hypothetical protein
MRSIVVAAVAALAFATAANATPGPAQGPYHLDSHGKCRNANGVLVVSRLCAGPPVNPYCQRGVSKPCGRTCIPLGETCHTQ